MSRSTPTPRNERGLQLALAWLAMAVLSFGFAVAATWWPGTVMAMVALASFVAMVSAFVGHARGTSRWAVWTVTAIAFAGWALLVFDAEGWQLLNFVMYALAYSTGRRSGIVLAAAVSTVWAASSIQHGDPGWVVLIAIGVFVVSSILAWTIYRAEADNHVQALLIEELEQSRRELAEAQRERGALEERRRLAAEIHDTVAQGLTSIVLLSRAAQRSHAAASALADIEQAATENLAATRRLVEAMRPLELEHGSLVDAIDRQVADSLPGLAGEVRVSGEARPLPGAVEIVLLRAAQEAVTNAATHANADRVDVTLSYLGGLVVLDVRDDGCGFAPGAVADRGGLTGGQGLQLLRERVVSLGGSAFVESTPGQGTVVSVQLPIEEHP